MNKNDIINIEIKLEEHGEEIIFNHHIKFDQYLDFINLLSEQNRKETLSMLTTTTKHVNHLKAPLKEPRVDWKAKYLEAQEEIKQLRAENMKLSAENLELKKQVAYLTRMVENLTEVLKHNNLM